ncbi:hypothetical protein RJ55_08038 [Drechmeria coniospora]|nr:hypothetical protein RJ55_08038 [Drechmeria coniospora]
MGPEDDEQRSGGREKDKRRRRSVRAARHQDHPSTWSCAPFGVGLRRRGEDGRLAVHVVVLDVLARRNRIIMLFATAVDDVFGSHFLHTERSLDVGRPTRSASMPVPSVGGPACDPVDDDETYQECPTSG